MKTPPALALRLRAGGASVAGMIYNDDGSVPPEPHGGNLSHAEFDAVWVAVQGAAYGWAPGHLRGPIDYLYVISWPDGAACKVGRSLNPRARVQSLQCGNPFPLDVLACWRAPRTSKHAWDGPILRLERAIQRVLTGLGREAEGGCEWFRANGQELACVVGLALVECPLIEECGGSAGVATHG